MNIKINKLLIVSLLIALSGSALFSQNYELLSSTVPSVRMNEAQRLGNEGIVEAIPSLINLLNDESVGVRINAVVSLGRMGTDEALVALVKVVHEDSSPAVKVMAVQELGRFGDVSAITTLLEALDEDNELVGAAAAHALGRRGGQKVLPKLIEKAQDSKSSARVKAASFDAITEVLEVETPDADTLSRIERASRRSSRDKNSKVKDAAEKTRMGAEKSRNRKRGEGNLK